MQQWVLLRKGADFKGIAKRFGITPRLAALLRNRDVIGDAAIDRYLNGSLKDLYDGSQMADMNQAVLILKEKIEAGKKIRIMGDYDIDGICSTYVLLKSLTELGAQVDYDIPDRVKDGYGLSLDLLVKAKEEGVDTILTCDNGISAYEETVWAKEEGMTVLITDHHEVPEHLPPADAVIDPKRADCPYPFDGLCGTAVAYKLIVCLSKAFGKEPADDLLEEVGFATVGDVMDLVDENRILVKEGIKRLRRTQNPGLKALIRVTGISSKSVTPYQIGYVLGPCLNASGRLDSAKRALALLLTTDPGEADRLAGDLKALNDSRKDMTQKQTALAMEQVEEEHLLRDKVLVIDLAECHESLAGIVAGRIREKYNRPTFVLTCGEDAVKGSGRSIPAYPMVEGLRLCADLCAKYGGHAMAAGLTLAPGVSVEEFRARINETCTLSEEDLAEKVEIDMELPFPCVTEEFIASLEIMEPFGKGNPKPVFAAREVTFLSGRIIGRHQNALKFTIRDACGVSMDAVYFGDPEEFLNHFDEKYGPGAGEDLLKGARKDMVMQITFDPQINEFRGVRTVQIVITHCQSGS